MSHQKSQFGDYIVYVDESGSPELKTVDPKYPCFVLAFCIFDKREYVSTVVPAVQGLKFKYWGHDGAILHTIDIKRELGDFRFLQHLSSKNAFLEDLNDLIDQVPFAVISAVIDKEKLKGRYSSPHDPYHLALKFCMERTQQFLMSRSQTDRETTIIVEERGKREDNELELEFLRIRDGDNSLGEMSNLHLRFCSKKANSSGLQLADLVATPIGRNYLNPNQPNRAYSIIQRKLASTSVGSVEGFGRKVFPK